TAKRAPEPRKSYPSPKRRRIIHDRLIPRLDPVPILPPARGEVSRLGILARNLGPQTVPEPRRGRPGKGWPATNRAPDAWGRKTPSRAGRFARPIRSSGARNFTRATGSAHPETVTH